MAKAILNLKNNYGFIIDMDIADPENPNVNVYDFEGNEVTGGIKLCNVKIINNTGGLAACNYNPTIVNGGIETNAQLPPIANGATVDLTGCGYAGDTPELSITFMKMTTPPAPATVTASDAVNCSYDATDPDYPFIAITGDNACITLTLS